MKNLQDNGNIRDDE